MHCARRKEGQQEREEAMANDVDSRRSILRREFVKGAILGAIVVPKRCDRPRLKAAGT